MSFNLGGITDTSGFVPPVDVETFVRPRTPSEASAAPESDAESAATEGADEEGATEGADSDVNYSVSEGPDSRQASIEAEEGTLFYSCAAIDVRKRSDQAVSFAAI